VVRALFVCSQNRLRSPTAEQIFSTWPNVESASAGVHESADVPLDPELIDWADVIFFMEKVHRAKALKRFPRQLGGKRQVVLNIPDNYKFMDPSLVKILESKAGPLLSR
jgi:predicted protein tyrosine phosphatase